MSQSDCRNAFLHIKALLEKGRDVLFGGTSCQVEALYRFLDKSYPSLFTVDLICHGVPGSSFFSDYIHFLSRKYKSKVTSFRFREKIEGDIQYIEVIELADGRIIKIPWKKSLYYQQFLRCESYRDSCYSCKYASVSKPGNITIGDYFEARNDYKELFATDKQLASVKDVSCLIINDKKGLELINRFGDAITFIEVDPLRVQISHNQLCAPTRYSYFRNKLFEMYRQGGFSKIARYYAFRDTVLWFPRRVYHMIKKE